MRGSDRETPTTRLPKQQGDQKGNRGERRRWHHPSRPKPSEEGRGGGGCSSPRVRGWMWLTMISHSVEISIAGGGEDMVRGQIPCPFFFLFKSFNICFNGTKHACSRSYGNKKPINQKQKQRKKHEINLEVPKTSRTAA